MLRLGKTGDAMNVVGDQIGGPTPAFDIAATLLDMACQMMNGQQGGTYHYAGTPAASWADFATEIFAQAGANVTVTGIPTSKYPTPARRPLNSRMDCGSLMTDFKIAAPEWKKGLRHVLAELQK